MMHNLEGYGTSYSSLSIARTIPRRRTRTEQDILLAVSLLEEGVAVAMAERVEAEALYLHLGQLRISGNCSLVFHLAFCFVLMSDIHPSIC